MRGSRFTQEQIVGVLAEHEAGAATAALCRRHGISEEACSRRKQKDRRLGAGRGDAAAGTGRENARLKRLVAERALDNRIPTDLLRKHA